MNVNDVEDREYLKGLPAGTAQPRADETWFGVWVRVQNEGDKTLPSAERGRSTTRREGLPPDPDRHERQPVRVPEGGRRAPATVLPLSSSAAGQGPIQGSLLLFKVKTDSLQNRPLELHFSNGQQGQTGIYDLDV